MEKRILLVEDDYVDAISFERSLKKLKLNYNMQIARNGRDALDLLMGKSNEKPEGMPDIIVLDLNMPRMNGIEFLEFLRSDRNLKNLVVFIATTANDEMDNANARRLGIAGYIIKPINFDGKGNKDSSMDNFSLMLELLK